MAELRRSAGAAAPALRDDHGQSWSFPPLATPDGVPHPDDGVGRPRATWLAFLPGAFTPVCTGELAWLADLAQELAAVDVAVRVIACDAAPVLRRVREDLGLGERLTLLSDFWPHGAAAAACDAFDPETGRARRVSVLLDATGVEVARVAAEPGRARSRSAHEAATREHLHRTGTLERSADL